MNQLEQQLDHLNYVAENFISRKRGRSAAIVFGNAKTGYRVCSCQTERFINFSPNQNYTRAAFIATWFVGYCCEELGYREILDKYDFVGVEGHGCYDHQCPSWLISAGFGRYKKDAKTFFDFGLISDFMEQALMVLKEEQISETQVYRLMRYCIDEINDDEHAQTCLREALDYVFPEEHKYYREPIRL